MRDAAIHADACIKSADISMKEWLKSWFDVDQVA